jgi:hypothetical protein
MGQNILFQATHIELDRRNGVLLCTLSEEGLKVILSASKTSIVRTKKDVAPL